MWGDQEHECTVHTERWNESIHFQNFQEKQINSAPGAWNISSLTQPVLHFHYGAKDKCVWSFLIFTVTSKTCISIHWFIICGNIQTPRQLLMLSHDMIQLFLCVFCHSDFYTWDQVVVTLGKSILPAATRRQWARAELSSQYDKLQLEPDLFFRCLYTSWVTVDNNLLWWNLRLWEKEI